MPPEITPNYQIVDAEAVAEMRRRVSTLESKPIQLAKLMAEYVKARFDRVAQQLKDLDVAPLDTGYQDVRAALIAKADRDVEKNYSDSFAKVADDEPKLRELLDDVKVAIQNATPYALYFQRLARMAADKRGEVISVANSVSESGAVELVRHAAAAGDSNLLAALYAIADAKGFRSVDKAIKATPSRELELMKKSMNETNARAKFALSNLESLRAHKPLGSTARIEFGLSTLAEGETLDPVA